MMTITEKPVDLSFYFVPFGGVKPVEMSVTHLLLDGTTEKTYFVFTHKNRSGNFFVREYLGSIQEKRFFTVRNEEILNGILKALKNDGMTITKKSEYFACDG